MKRILAPICIVVLVGVLLSCESQITPPPVASGSDAAILAETNGLPPVFARMNGGGQILEGEFKISFAGNAQGYAEHAVLNDRDWWVATDPKAQWVVQFHNVSQSQLTGRTFKSTYVENFQVRRNTQLGSSCEAYGILSVTGRLDGEAGWNVQFRGMDAGQDARKDEFDTVRLVVQDPSGTQIYDSFDGSGQGDFPGESVCAGPRRQRLDKGNIKVSIRPLD